MILTDTHTHLYVTQFDEDRAEMLQRAFDTGVTRLFLPNIDKSTKAAMLSLAETYPDRCFPMLGVHPGSVKEDYQEELEVVEQGLFGNEADKYCAVGEIGLDYYWDTTFKEQQKEAFRTQINWAKQLKKPVVIHCRESYDDIMTILEEEHTDDLTGVLHCFTGTVEEANRVFDLGFYVGIGGVVTFKKSGLADVVQQIDLDRIVLETDSPYLTPTPFRGKRNESSYIKYVAEKVAEAKGLELLEVAERTTANSMNLFGI